MPQEDHNFYQATYFKKSLHCAMVAARFHEHSFKTMTMDLNIWAKMNL